MTHALVGLRSHHQFAVSSKARTFRAHDLTEAIPMLDFEGHEVKAPFCLALLRKRASPSHIMARSIVAISQEANHKIARIEPWQLRG